MVSTGVTTPPDQAPIAVIDPVAKVIDSDGDGSESMTVTQSATDDNGIAGYDWQIDGSSVGSAASLTYAFPVGSTNLSLVVTDTAGQTDGASVLVTVDPAPDAVPAVDAGADASAQLAAGTATVVLDGTVSDDGPVTVSWTASGPAAVIFGDATAVDTDATFTVAGTYTLSLTADDGVNASVADTLTITVIDEATPVDPTAIDFRNLTFVSYDSSQDKGGTVTVSGDGTTATFTGNTWKAAALSAEISADTVLVSNSARP